MDKAQQMSSFAAVVDAGSFVAAAEALGVSKAAVSRHVAELEQRLGVRLLHRTTRKLSLTDEGRRFYARSKELLAAIDEAESELVPQRGEPRGLVRVNAPLTFGMLHLAPLWGAFMARHPQVTLDVTLADRTVDLIEDGYDLAVRITARERLANAMLVARPLATSRIVACASPGYLRQFGTPQTPADLAAHRIIAYSYWASGDEWVYRGPDGDGRVRLRPCMHTNNGDTCRLVALQDQGLILQPDFLVGDDLKRGLLVEVLADYRTPDIEVFALYPTRKHLPLKVRALIDFLAEAFVAPTWR
ncbi:LysR family transcriptional regulator [Solimonas marina]|uniref:LysR family transcriptional regulator n=1 Tax=Solimonas marina TaxID=2714601 RepID=A0A970B4R3_9GAMM|nr:LysR family transcriptional regulator [Solimonas marina]NKF20903.1 LysR family transcriptional regulator [Solimonas marina]